MEYVYDIGDCWGHALIVERMTAPLPNVIYPQFLGGERRCPPEDCGGFYPATMNSWATLPAMTARSARARSIGMGGPYDPDDINERKIVSALRRLGGQAAKRQSTR